MSKYVYAEATTDYYPSIRTVVANSYGDAVDKVIELYKEQFTEDDFEIVDDWESLQDYLNKNYYIALSDLEDIEEL